MNLMNQEEISVFVEGLVNYFNMNLGGEVSVGEVTKMSPPESPVFDFTGVIGISGAKKGCVYFTGPKELITQILINLGEEDVDDELLSDMTGEIANTIAGNASSKFGPDYQMSVPVVVAGRPDSINLPKDLVAYVIPVTWQSLTSNLVICFE